MKLLKLTSLSLIVVAALGAYSAKADVIGVTTNSTKLNVSLIITTNVPGTWKGDTYTSKTKSVKITNKLLLELFAGWSDNSFSTKGAKLVIGWDSPWNGDVLVVDETGTNVLFNADASDANHFTMDYFDEYGAYSEKNVDKSPGSYSYTDFNGGYFELYDDNFYLPYTYLWGYGSSTVKFSENWDGNGDYKNWKASTMFKSVGEGDQYFLDNGSDSTARGDINANGSGKGNNNYFNID